MAKKRVVLDAGGIDVSVSSPDKIYFAQAGIRKLEVVEYYRAVAEAALRSPGASWPTPIPPTSRCARCPPVFGRSATLTRRWRPTPAISRRRGSSSLEINCDPHRLDLPAAEVRAARARGIPFVLSADAHSVEAMDVVPYGIRLARRAGVTAGEVLNTRSFDAFARAVRPAGPRS